MKPVQQTEMIPGGGGNCVAACVASIFELPLTMTYPEIPLGGGAQKVMDWTERHYPALHYVDRSHGRYEQQGDRYVELEPYEVLEHMRQDLIPWGVEFWIAYVVSPRGVISHHDWGYWHPSLHAVVCSGSEVVWDPHPRRDMGVGAVRKVGYWVVKDPALL